MTDGFVISMFGALFAVMNPFVNLPIFLGLTEGMQRSDQRRAAIQVVFYTAITCGVVAVGGSAILSFFDISIDAFRVAGGLVLMQIGFHMLNGNESPAHHGSQAEQADNATRDSIAFYPMTFPMLVGPGTITTLILFAGQAKNVANWVAYAICVGLVIGILAVVLYFAGDIGQHLSRTARTIMSRLMGMILLAIAIGMIVAGAKVLLPGLA
ncbi:MarC family protein [Shimia sp.]|uniref:MarC family protein n=1 Tax=Shimia sp. TaxID=1954381 RepID=UPI003298D7D9